MTNRLENFTFKTTTPNRLKDFPSKTPISNRLEDFKAPGPAVSVLDPNKPLGFVEDIIPTAPGMRIADPKDISLDLPGPPPIGIRESVAEEFTRPSKGAQYVPGVGGIVGTAENLLYIDAGQRLQSGFDYKQPIRPEQIMPGAMGIRPARYTTKVKDQKIIEYLLIRMENQQRGYTFGGKVAKGILNLPTWMAEFAMTGGLASLGSNAAKEAGAKLIGRWATTKAGQIALRGAGWMGGAITRATLGLAPRITQEFTRRRLPEQFTIDEQGRVVDFKWPKEKPFTSFAKAWGGMVIAAASEEAGKTITGVPVALLNKTKFGGKFIRALRIGWMETTGGTAGDFVGRMLRKGGYSNILGEYGEEGLESLLRSSTGVDDFGAKLAYEKEKGEGSWDKLDASDKLGKRLVAAANQELDPTNIGVRLSVLSTPVAGRVAIGTMLGEAPKTQIKESLVKEGVSEKVAQRAVEMLEAGWTPAEVDRNLVAPSRLLGDRVLDLDEKAIDQAQTKEKPTGAEEERWFEKDIFGARRILGIVGRLFSKGSEKTENDIVTEIKSKQPSLKEDEARQLARRHIASQIEYEKVIYDELLQRHFQGDKKATEDLNNLVQEFHLPTYEAYLKKINEASDYYAEYIQEGMLGRGPVKPKSIKSFIAPKEGVPTETAETPRPGIGGQAATRGVQVPDIAPERLSVPEGVRTPPGGEIEATESKYGGIPFPSEEPGRISLKEAFERKAGPTTKKTIPELQAEIDGYLRAQKNPPTELLAEFNAAVKAKKGKRVISEDSYKAAKKRLTDRNTLRMGIDPQGFIDLATIGAYHIESGLRTFGKWSQKMVEEFGDKIKPELKKIWKDSRQLAGKAAQGRKPKLAVGISEFMAEDVQPTIAKVKEAGKTLREIGLAAPKLFMKVIEPAKAAERMTGKVAASTTIRAIHRATDVAQWEWEAQRNETMDMNMEQLKKFFEQFSKKENRDFFVAYAGKPGSIEAEQIQREAKKRLPDILKQPRLVSAIREISEKNHKALKQVVGDNIGWVEDYFYGLYKNPSTVFAKWKKSTKRFTKHKVIPSLADVINMGSEALHDNYIDNLKAEYMGIARLGAMTWLKTELMRTGEGVYIDNMGDAPVDWSKVEDPVFKAYLVQPDLALLINNLISTNKVTQQPALNAARKVGNFLRITKFIGSIYHLRSEIQQAIADSGYLGFLHKKTALRGFQSLAARKKQWEKLRRSPEYKRLLENGIGYRYSYEQQAQKQFKDFVDKFNRGNFIGATIRGAKIPLKIPARFTGWLFDQMIPMTKTLKVMDAQMELEKKEGRPATDWEIQNIIKETQNFYGEMNERLFGRSGTVTTTMRFIYLAPGFAEGNYRTILKSLLQWGQGEGWRAGRSRSNMVNSPLITATIATLGTLMLTGKQPKKPENLEDVRDLFKIDTGKKDARGRKVMIDMMTYDKDYWNIYFNVLRGRPDVAAYESLRRLGGMKSPLYDMFLDFQMMSTGKAILDWKGDRVTEITDTSLEKLMKIAIHEIKKTEPIPMSVYKQSRRKEVGKIISFVQAVAGVRPTLTEKDKREGEILRRCWSLSHQKEDTYRDLATLHRPRGAVKWYNNKVKDVLESKLVPKSMKDEWIPKLTIDLEKYLQNKAMDASRLPTTKESKEQIEKAVKILKNFDISPNAAEQLLTDYYKRPKTKVPYSPIESDRILGRARKKKRLKERMQ